MTMAQPVLLDTNVASFLFAVRPERALYQSALRDRRLAISFQTEAEMLAGADARGWGAKRRRMLAKFFDGVMVIYPERETVRTWAHLRAALEKQGLVVETADMWIASIALTRNLTLLAHDAVFRQIAGLKLVCHA
ncbi:MAG: PIN domain-containing protein [Planctomycetes bacterium]|nr:PIN domain-containing protein [Planctomycetota bacterium]MCO5172473.1 PIN domain-containing protein [Planctomycetota bacterium]